MVAQGRQSRGPHLQHPKRRRTAQLHAFTPPQTPSLNASPRPYSALSRYPPSLSHPHSLPSRATTPTLSATTHLRVDLVQRFKDELHKGALTHRTSLLGECARLCRGIGSEAWAGRQITAGRQVETG